MYISHELCTPVTNYVCTDVLHVHVSCHTRDISVAVFYEVTNYVHQLWNMYIPYVHVSCHTRDISHELCTSVTNYVHQSRTMYVPHVHVSCHTRDISVAVFYEVTPYGDATSRHVGLFSTERGKRDVENQIIDLDLGLENGLSKCNRLQKSPIKETIFCKET